METMEFHAIHGIPPGLSIIPYPLWITPPRNLLSKPFFTLLRALQGCLQSLEAQADHQGVSSSIP